MKNKKVLSELKSKSEYFKKLILVSVLIATGINLLTNGIINILSPELQPYIIILLGIVLCTVVILLIFINNIKNLSKIVKFNGFILYDESKKVILPVNGYKVSEDIVKYLNAAFVENKAFKKIWGSHQISEIEVLGGKKGERAIGRASESTYLFIELVEYCILRKLAIHLTDFFNGINLGKEKLEEFEKRDIPEVLLDNRFLKLFTEDMNNRELFNQEIDSPDVIDIKKDDKLSKRPNQSSFVIAKEQYGIAKDGQRKIVTAYHPSGAIYDLFEFVLPQKSKVIRKNKNTIILDMDLFSLSLSCLFGGFSTILGDDFEKYYLGVEFDQYHSYEFNVEIEINYKPKSYFSSKRWDYYMWIDNFIDKLSDYMDKDTFFERINWNTVYAIMQCSEKSGVLNKPIAYPPA